jgi:DNA-binding MarR family transcriptional regulator
MNPLQFKTFISKFITERVGETGLTESQIVFLIILDKEKGLSLKEMTERVGVHKSLTTRSVKHLIDNEFVVNISESGKEHAIVLTAKGARAKDSANRAFCELFEFVFEDVTDEEFAVFEEVMSKIRRRMEEISSNEPPSTKEK